MRLHGLALGRHVVGVHERALDEAIHALAGGVLLGRDRAGDDVGRQREPGAVDLAVPDLGVAGGVREDELERYSFGKADRAVIQAIKDKPRRLL